MPNFANAYTNLGHAYSITGDKAAALKEYKILKMLNPKLADKFFDLIYK